MQNRNVFHEHLDVCTQCAANPHGLCATGAALLKQAATSEINGEPDDVATARQRQADRTRFNRRIAASLGRV